MKKGKLYSVLGLACLAGYLYLMVYLFLVPEGSGLGMCIFKNLTGIPCPSCGATRAVKALLDGQFASSLRINPIGMLLAFCMLALPVWLAADVLFKRQSLYLFYQRFESVVRKPVVAVLLIALVLANWIWGISKGL